MLRGFDYDGSHVETKGLSPGGQVIAVAKKKLCRSDHLFEDTRCENRFGIYYQRHSKQAATYARRKYRDHLARHRVDVGGEQIGDFDGII